MKKFIVIASALVLSLSACSNSPSNSSTSSTDEDTQTVSTQEATTAEDTQENSEESSEADSFVKEYGSTFTWPTGEEVTVSAPEPGELSSFMESEYITSDDQEVVEMEVTFVNNSDEPISPFAWLIFDATTGDTQAEQVFDTEAGYDGGPTADILPGKTATWKIAFVRTVGEEFILQVSPMLGDAGYYQE